MLLQEVSNSNTTHTDTHYSDRSATKSRCLTSVDLPHRWQIFRWPLTYTRGHLSHPASVLQETCTCGRLSGCCSAHDRPGVTRDPTAPVLGGPSGNTEGAPWKITLCKDKGFSYELCVLTDADHQSHTFREQGINQ